MKNGGRLPLLNFGGHIFSSCRLSRWVSQALLGCFTGSEQPESIPCSYSRHHSELPPCKQEAGSGPGESLTPRSHPTLRAALTPFLRPGGSGFAGFRSRYGGARFTSGTPCSFSQQFFGARRPAVVCLRPLPARSEQGRRPRLPDLDVQAQVPEQTPLAKLRTFCQMHRVVLISRSAQALRFP